MIVLSPAKISYPTFLLLTGLPLAIPKVVKIFDPNTEQNEVIYPNFSTEKTFYTKYGECPLFLLFLILIVLNLYFGKFTN